MSLLNQLREAFHDHFGIRIEQPPVSKNVTAVESAAAISHVFDADAARHDLDHEIAMSGGSRPRLATNAVELGFDRQSFGRATAEWLK